MVLELQTCDPAAVLTPPLWRSMKQGSLRESVTGKILSVIYSDMRFLTLNHHIVTEFSSQVSDGNYPQREFRLGEHWKGKQTSERGHGPLPLPLEPLLMRPLMAAVLSGRFGNVTKENLRNLV